MHLGDQAGEPLRAAHEQPARRRRERSFTTGERILCRGVTGREERRADDLQRADRRAGHDRPACGCETTTLVLLPPNPNALTSTCSMRAGVSRSTISTPRSTRSDSEEAT